MTERVLIVGAGHVGRGLYRAFHASGVEVLGIHGRRSSAYTTSSGPRPANLGDVNTVVVAVRDDQIDEAVAQLINSRAERNRISSGTVVIHTSGAAEPSLIPRLAEFGLSGGTFHPMIPFADSERVPDLLKHAWVGIDGDDTARATSRRLAGHVGARTLDIPMGGKAIYHAAAVISSNFPVVLADVASGLLMSLGVPQRSAEQAVNGLMAGAVENLKIASPVEVLTGPIARGETETILHHLAALRGDADAKSLYKRLSLAALDIANRRGVDPATIEEMRNALLLR